MIEGALIKYSPNSQAISQLFIKEQFSNAQSPLNALNMMEKHLLMYSEMF